MLQAGRTGADFLNILLIFRPRGWELTKSLLWVPPVCRDYLTKSDYDIMLAS
jgi:hypothetical protein